MDDFQCILISIIATALARKLYPVLPSVKLDVISAPALQSYTRVHVGTRHQDYGT